MSSQLPTSSFSYLPRITIDSNEGDSEYIGMLNQDELFEVVRERLEVGDILIEDLIIERKTRTDFFDSVRDGRLFRQLLIMKRLYRKRILLIEGSLDPPVGISKSALEGLITRIVGSLQIPILFSNGAVMSARFLRRMALQLYGFTSPQSSRTIGPNRTQGFHEIHILVGIPGIGLTRAKALISFFGSLQKVFSASEKEFRSIEGIGDYLARELVRLFNNGS